MTSPNTQVEGYEKSTVNGCDNTKNDGNSLTKLIIGVAKENDSVTLESDEESVSNCRRLDKLQRKPCDLRNNIISKKYYNKLNSNE